MAYEEDYSGKKWNEQDPKLVGTKIYVSSELLKNYNNNDLFLKDQTEQLWKETSITSRKTFSPIPIDEVVSYNVEATTSGAGLDESTAKSFPLPFLETHIDVPKSEPTVVIEDKKVTIKKPKKYTEKSVTYVTKLNQCTRNYGPRVIFKDGATEETYCTMIAGDDVSSNAHWYIGYNKSSKYNVKPEWLKNQNSFKIPSVCRAQVFEAKASGQIKAIDLLLGADGKVNQRYPLIVDVIECETKGGIAYPQSLKNASKVWSNVIIEPDELRAYSRFVITNGLGGNVVQGKCYAIVLRSPLTKYNNAYRIGGWGKNCGAKPYKQYAFLSEDNGYTWKIHGKGENVAYRHGKRAPETFSFMVEIEERVPVVTTTEKEVMEEEEVTVPSDPILTDDPPAPTPKAVLYTKRIDTNPCYRLSCSAEFTGGGSKSIHLWDNQSRDWTEVQLGTPITFSGDTVESLPDTFIIKVQLTASTYDDAPSLKNLNVLVETHPARQGTLRTKQYIPNTNGILGANVYATLNAPVELTNPEKSEVLIDIVRDRIESEIFYIIVFEELITLEEKVPAVIPYKEVIKKILEETDATVKKQRIEEFLTNNVPLVDEFNKEGYYISDDPNFDSFELWDDVADPLLDCIFEEYKGKEEGGEVVSPSSVSYSEYIDYEVDYEKKTISFYSDVLNDIKNNKQQGTLTVRYNPLFIKGIRQEEFPVDLDVHTETFIPTEDEVKNNMMERTLRMPILDPLRDVQTQKSTSPIKIDLVEFEEYFVDYQTKIVRVFPKDKLTLNSKVIIQYTPNLDDPNISLQYRLKRQTEDPINIKPYSIDVRV